MVMGRTGQTCQGTVIECGWLLQFHLKAKSRCCSYSKGSEKIRVSKYICVIGYLLNLNFDLKNERNKQSKME